MAGKKYLVINSNFGFFGLRIANYKAYQSFRSLIKGFPKVDPPSAACSPIRHIMTPVSARRRLPLHKYRQEHSRHSSHITRNVTTHV